MGIDTKILNFFTLLTYGYLNSIMVINIQQQMVYIIDSILYVNIDLSIYKYMSLYWLKSSRLLFSYSRDKRLPKGLFILSQDLRKEHAVQNFPVNRRKSSLTPFLYGREGPQHVLPSPPGELLGPFQHPDSSSAYREPPRLTPHCHTDVTRLSHKPEHRRVFSKNPRENNHFIYLRGEKCCMLTPPVFLWQKLQFSFLLSSKFLRLALHNFPQKERNLSDG